MSERGRQVIAEIDRLERVELERRWRPYAQKLTGEERKRIMAGDSRPLERPVKPDMVPGQAIVLSWSRPKPQYDHGAGQLIPAPPMRKLVWIEIVSATFARGGGWKVRFKLCDVRERKRFLAPLSPRSKGGEAGLKTRWRSPEEVKKARKRKAPAMSEEEARGYSSGPVSRRPGQRGEGATDDQESVDDAILEEFVKENHAKDQARFAEDKAELQALPLSERLKRLEELESKGANVSRELRSAKKAIEAAERKTDRIAA